MLSPFGQTLLGFFHTGAEGGIRTHEPLQDRLLKSNCNVDPSKYYDLTLAKIDWIAFDLWLKEKYRPNTYKTVKSYSHRYKHLILANSNLSEFDTINPKIKNNTIKSLIALSKFLGIYAEFKNRLNIARICLVRPNALDAVLRIIEVNEKPADKNTLAYYKQIQPILLPSERLYTNFLMHCGMRPAEAIEAFNQIIELTRAGRINEYYNADWQLLMHFRYKEKFLRTTKLALVSFCSPNMLHEIGNSQPVSYYAIRKRLEHAKIPIRLSEFRDYFSTYLLDAGIKPMEVELLTGKMGTSILARHYWGPQLKELGDRVLKATVKMERLKLT